MIHIPREYCPTLFTLFTCLGAGFGIMGVQNVMEGVGNNIPDVQRLGEQQMKAGGMLAFLGGYIAKNGTLPEPEIMDYLVSR